MKSVLNALKLILTIGIIFMIPICVYEYNNYSKQKIEWESIPEMSNIPSTENMNILDIDVDEFPDDSLFIEAKRAEFKSGDLRLVIPKIGVDDDVMDGTDASALKHGPGLYTVAQMPRPRYDINTSIAAHRAGYGRYGNLFKYIEDIQNNDLLYLVDKDWIYIYNYLDTKIVEPDDVSVLYLQGFTCLTLTSCHPLGGNKQRIVVRAKLEKVVENTDSFVYLESKE